MKKTIAYQNWALLNEPVGSSTNHRVWALTERSRNVYVKATFLSGIIVLSGITYYMRSTCNQQASHLSGASMARFDT